MIFNFLNKNMIYIIKINVTLENAIANNDEKYDQKRAIVKSCIY